MPGRRQLPDGAALLVPITADHPLGLPELRHSTQNITDELRVQARGPRLASIEAVDGDHVQRPALRRLNDATSGDGAPWRAPSPPSGRP